MLALHDDGGSLWSEGLVDGVGDLRGQLLLHLQPFAERVHDARDGCHSERMRLPPAGDGARSARLLFLRHRKRLRVGVGERVVVPDPRQRLGAFLPLAAAAKPADFYVQSVKPSLEIEPVLFCQDFRRRHNGYLVAAGDGLQRGGKDRAVVLPVLPDEVAGDVQGGEGGQVVDGGDGEPRM